MSMKKIIIPSIAVLLALPSLAFAAFDSVQLETAVDLSLDSYTLDVSGTTATIESIEVGATSFTATLQAGSKIQVSSPTFNKLSHSTTYTGEAGNVDVVC